MTTTYKNIPITTEMVNGNLKHTITTKAITLKFNSLLDAMNYVDTMLEKK